MRGQKSGAGFNHPFDLSAVIQSPMKKFKLDKMELGVVPENNVLPPPATKTTATSNEGASIVKCFSTTDLAGVEANDRFETWISTSDPLNLRGGRRIHLFVANVNPPRALRPVCYIPPLSGLGQQ